MAACVPLVPISPAAGWISPILGRDPSPQAGHAKRMPSVPPKQLVMPAGISSHPPPALEDPKSSPALLPSPH